MTRFAVRFRPSVAAAVAALAVAGGAHAHFPWLTTDDQGRALLFFGETLEDRTYKVPEAVATAEVFSRTGDQRKPLALELVEEDDYIGRRSSAPAAKGAVLETTCDYGLYQSMLLTYYVKHLPADGATWEKVAPSKELKLDAVPRLTKDGVTLAVTWNGKPLNGAAVSLSDSEGGVQEAKTDEHGEASFAKIPSGTIGIGYNFLEEVKGKVDGKEYFSHGHYGTLTFEYRQPEHGATETGDAASSPSAATYPALPEPVSSFGAAAADGWLYVYGGHTGVEHDHSRDNLSPRFVRIKLDDGQDWEEMPMQTPLQGLPLVAHGGKLYRVGGLSARNPQGEEADLHSVDEFAAFDPATRQWTDLAPLPEPRSSHDAVVIGDTLYVVGGWTLAGEGEGAWLDTAWSFNLAKPDGGWQAVAAPNFRRRALAVAQWDGKLVALGGMDEDRKISRRVDALDLPSGQWNRLADLPGERMDGFGAAAWNLDGQLFASGTQESLYRLADDGGAWQAAGELETPRFFHRLTPGRPGMLLAVAGASMDGHLATIEQLAPTIETAQRQ